MSRVKDFLRYVWFDCRRHGFGFFAFAIASVMVAFLATSALGVAGYMPPVFDAYGEAPYDNYSAFYATDESGLEQLAAEYPIIGKAVTGVRIKNNQFPYRKVDSVVPYQIVAEVTTASVGQLLRCNLAAGRMPQAPYEAVGIMEYTSGEDGKTSPMFRLGQTYTMGCYGEELEIRIVGVVPWNNALPSIMHAYGSYGKVMVTSMQDLLIVLPDDHKAFTCEEQVVLSNLFYLAQMNTAQVEQFTAEQEKEDCYVHGSNFTQAYQECQAKKKQNTEAQFVMLHIAIMLLGSIGIIACITSAMYENSNRRERAICYLTGVTPSMLLGGRLVNLFVGFAVSVGVVSAILIPFVNMTLANPGYGLTIYPVHLPFGYLAVVAMFAVMTVIDCIKIKRQNYLNSIHGEAMA